MWQTLQALAGTRPPAIEEATCLRSPWHFVQAPTPLLPKATARRAAR